MKNPLQLAGLGLSRVRGGRMCEANAEAVQRFTLKNAVGRDAWERRGDAVPDIVHSDVMMPHLDGLESCRRIKADPRWRKVPAVPRSAEGAVDHPVDGRAAGADDYQAKLFSVAELLLSAGYFSRRHRQVQGNGPASRADFS